MSGEILLIGSRFSKNERLKGELTAKDYFVVTALGNEDALAKATGSRIDVVLNDLTTHSLAGFELLKRLHSAKPRLPVIVTARKLNEEEAIEASRLGAYAYLSEPIELRELIELIARAVESNRLSVRGSVLEIPAAFDRVRLVGSSSKMRELYDQIGRAADTSATVLIRGATGTGKELIARAIHQHGARAREPFVAVNCSSLPESLLESELFGFEAGAFTGARARRPGWFEAADKGTLFLDEVGELKLDAQVKLLRFLQERTIQRLGGRQDVSVNVRIVAATNRDLESAMKDGRFRQDLFYRLSGLTILSPSLIEHLEDIPELMRHFLAKWAKERNAQTVSIHCEAAEFLQSHPWPGNIRQLENALYGAANFANGRPIKVNHMKLASGAIKDLVQPNPARPRQPLTDLFEKASTGQLPNLRATYLQDTDRTLFERAMGLARSNKVKAARLLGITRKTLKAKLSQFGIR